MNTYNDWASTDCIVCGTYTKCYQVEDSDTYLCSNESCKATYIDDRQEAYLDALDSLIKQIMNN